MFEDKRYRYDRFGRLSEKRIGSHTVQRFRYDAEQRLVCVEQDQGWQRLRSEYRYDPLGRRIGKRVYRNESEQPQTDVQFVWQGMRLLQEVEHGFGSVYVYADSDSYEPLARIDGKPGSEDIFYFHTNLAGLPEQLTDEAGLSVWRSEYEGWGKSRDEWHDQRVRREQNLRFQGQYLDRETGLHYNTFRFYDADVGRFTQLDPIGLLGGVNLYQYAPNPIDWVDPWGLASCGQNSRILGKNLAREGRPVGPGQAAGHIVASGGSKGHWVPAAKSRALLEKYRININDPANGIPVNHPNPHGAMHTAAFQVNTLNRLQSVESKMLQQNYGKNAIRDALRRELRSIGKDTLK